ncbi:hypothetical protein BDY24DRAFT_418997 [Mrakia frigida]|uniref:uncharacterized protein n=1 Tax=Mrakia frigida TaxID=29902 RepID=UPI003FCBF622
MSPAQQLAALREAMDNLRVEHAREVTFLRRENDILHERLLRAQQTSSPSPSPRSSGYLAPHLRVPSTPRQPPRRDLPWDVIINIFQKCEDPSTLAVASRASFDLLQLCSPLLYETVVLKSTKRVEMLFCKRAETPSNPRILPFLSLDQIQTLHLFIPPSVGHVAYPWRSRFLKPPTNFPPNLHLTYNLPCRANDPKFDIHPFPIFAPAYEYLLSLCNPTRLSFSYIGPYSKGDTWMPLDLGIVIGETMLDAFTNVRTVLLDRCIPFDLSDERMSFVLQNSETIRDAVITFNLTSPRTSKGERERIVDELGRFGCLSLRHLKKVVVRVKAWREIEDVEKGIRRTDPDYLRVPVEVVSLEGAKEVGAGASAGRARGSRSRRGRGGREAAIQEIRKREPNALIF